MLFFKKEEEEEEEEELVYRKEKEGEGGQSLFKEIIAENFLNLGKELDIQVRNTSRTPYYLNAKRPFGGGEK